jgi:SAM-dependent methyltransferase
MRRLLKAVLRKSGIYPAYRSTTQALDRAEAVVWRLAVMATYETAPFYLNVGGGYFARKNWRVLDVHSRQYPYLRALLDYELDLLEQRAWPIADASVDLVYCSHCLEHLTDACASLVFSEVFRVLKPGGIFRLTAPDIDLAYRAYAADDHAFFAALRRDERSVEATLLAYFSPYLEAEIDTRRVREDFRRLDKLAFLDTYTLEAPRDDHDYSRHLTWFDRDKIRRLAKHAGFEARRVLDSAFRQSICAEMRGDQFDDNWPPLSLYFDIVK